METPPWNAYLPQFPLPTHLITTRCQQNQWTWIFPPVLSASQSSESLKKKKSRGAHGCHWNDGPVLSQSGCCWYHYILLVKSVNSIISALCSLSKMHLAFTTLRPSLPICILNYLHILLSPLVDENCFKRKHFIYLCTVPPLQVLRLVLCAVGIM